VVLAVSMVRSRLACWLKPDADCRDRGGCRNRGPSLTGSVLEMVGLLPAFVRRWDEAGQLALVTTKIEDDEEA
jgi:hypothetical protein